MCVLEVENVEMLFMFKIKDWFLFSGLLKPLTLKEHMLISAIFDKMIREGAMGKEIERKAH